MDNNNEKSLEIPVWLLHNEHYAPQSDQDTFITRTILSLLKLLSKIKTQDNITPSKYQVNVTLRVAFTFLLLILLSVSQSFIFVIIINVYLLFIVSLMESKAIVNILKVSLGMTAFTFLVMLPALLLGNSYSCIMITSKAFATITAVGLLSHKSKWSLITSSFKQFFLPDLFILVLDITLKYIVMLGEFALNMLYALKLRSVGRNRGKYGSLSGIAGTMFIKSKEMAEDMYYAMECRGFVGEYRVHTKSKLRLADYIYILINVGIVLIFIYFWKGIK